MRVVRGDGNDTRFQTALEFSFEYPCCSSARRQYMSGEADDLCIARFIAVWVVTVEWNENRVEESFGPSHST
jgi:hypothetical protein